MRVVHVLAERGYSGGEVQLEHLVRHLAARGHEQALVLAPGARFAQAIADLRLPRIELTLRGVRLGSWRRYRAFLTAHAPDVLHLGCGRSLLWGGLVGLGLAVPARVTTRRIDYPISKSWWRGGRYRRLVDHVVANCESVRRRVLAAGVPEHRVTLVHEGIELGPWARVTEGRAAARQQLGIGDGDLVVSCPATLRPRKGQRVLIDAFAGVLDEHPRARLILAGEGPDRDALRRRADRSGAGGRIDLPGEVRPVAELYAASDLVVMPSFHEGLSNACLEASAAGLPLVVSSVGGLPEIVVNGETGAVVAPGDVAELGLALRRYLADGDLRRRAGEAGRRRTTSLFGHERMTARMEALFLDLCQRAER